MLGSSLAVSSGYFQLDMQPRIYIVPTFILHMVKCITCVNSLRPSNAYMRR